MSGAGPTVSVLMPVYNAEGFLAPAIESVLGQRYGDFELIVIDDGSTDGSRAMLERYAAGDKRVRLISRPNTGYSVALREMTALARGSLVARMDADDISMQERFARQVEFFEQHPGAVAVGSAFELMDEAGRRLTTFQPPTSDREIQALLLKGHTAICHPTVMMRTEMLRTVGGYDPALQPAEDLDLFLRLGELGSLANLAEPLLRYRLHASSVSERAGSKQRERQMEACRRAWARRGIAGEFEAREPWRPGPTRGSRHEFTLRYGWWAFNSGERRTAAAYGARAVALMPWRIDSWRLLACAMIKHPEASRA